jgi:hypothetical protein
MHKEAKCDEDIEVLDSCRWLCDSKAVKFLLKTKSAYLINELIEVKKHLSFKPYLLTFSKHLLFSYKRQKISLKANVYIAKFSI